MERTYLHKGTYCNFPVFAWLADTLFGQKARARSAMSWFMPHILKGQPILGGGNSNYVFIFTPIWEDLPIWRLHIFQMGGSTTNQNFKPWNQHEHKMLHGGNGILKGGARRSRLHLHLRSAPTIVYGPRWSSMATCKTEGSGEKYHAGRCFFVWDAGRRWRNM